MAEVVAVCSSSEHSFSKPVRDVITLEAGLGVAGDAHEGITVKHRSRVAKDPTQPNLRQVHLIHAELFDLLRSKGYTVAPGDMGENVTTVGIDLLTLPTGTRLSFQSGAEIALTGLRNPCAQIEQLGRGLTAAVLERHEDGSLARLAGVMAVVLSGGEIRSGDRITVQHPAEPHQPLECV
ncbi:MOSC domain-containing protein [Tianweitania sp.]|uniref:MOSC domain-containing protein n=1 Tax=Tianweitania sp. TaxID=2021634 RepID=UPI003A100CA1